MSTIVKRQKSVPARVLILVPLGVSAVAISFMALGYVLLVIFGIPIRLDLPISVRFVGLLMIAFALFLLGWLFKYRKPIDILVSTYATFSKAIAGTRLHKRSGRTEPLIVKGPYKYLRHPLYFDVLVFLLGWWLLLDQTFLAASAILLLLWFNFVVCPFEEKELFAIFGASYKRYARRVPRIIPVPKM